MSEQPDLKAAIALDQLRNRAWYVIDVAAVATFLVVAVELFGGAALLLFTSAWLLGVIALVAALPTYVVLRTCEVGLRLLLSLSSGTPIAPPPT